MAYINDPDGRLCDWGIPRTECYGARLPLDYQGDVPPQMLLIDVPEAEYIVFEHGPFDYEQENSGLRQEDCPVLFLPHSPFCSARIPKTLPRCPASPIRGIRHPLSVRSRRVMLPLAS